MGGRKKSKFDYAAALEAKKNGIAQVLDGEDDFSIAVAKYVINMKRGWEGLFEEIRMEWEDDLALPQPHHRNCWGAISNALVRAGVLKKTGKMRPPTGIKSHCRPTNILRRV